MSSMDDMRVMTNNIGALVDLGVNLLTVSGNDVLTFFSVDGVNDNIIFLMTLLSLLFNWLLVALLLNILVALGSRVIFLLSWVSLSISLSIVTSMTSMNDLRIMTNNLRAVVNLLVNFLTVFSYNVLTFLNVGGVNNSLADWSWNLV